MVGERNRVKGICVVGIKMMISRKFRNKSF